MTSPELQPDVRRYLLTSVPSVPYLEAVLLLRAAPGDAWDAARLARRLYVPERRGVELLSQLRESGIAVEAGEAGAVRYGPEPELATLVDRVAEAYAFDLVGVSSLIHSRIDRRAQQFADAFRFRKD
jgi:hypothetical protein